MRFLASVLLLAMIGLRGARIPWSIGVGSLLLNWRGGVLLFINNTSNLGPSIS